MDALTQHALASNDDLFRLLFDRQGAYKRCHFFGRLPLRELAETLLARPDTRVNDLKEELTRSWVKDEDGAIWSAFGMKKRFIEESRTTYLSMKEEEQISKEGRSKEEVRTGFVVKFPSKVLCL